MLVKSLEISISRIKKMINNGMDNDAKMLHKLIKIAKEELVKLILEKYALTPDKNAQYFETLTIDLDQIDEPMIADLMLIILIFLNDIHMILFDLFLIMKRKK